MGAQALRIPQGVTLSSTAEGVVVEHDGDIEIHASGSFARLVSRHGTVRLSGAVSVGEVLAGGSVELNDGSSAGSIRAGGDVALWGKVTVGGAIEAPSGSVVAEGQVRLQRVHAGGLIEASGTVEATEFIGGVVRLGGTISVKAVEGQARVELRPGTYKGDVVIAPEVRIDPGVTGRISVVESSNELGPNALKGGFRLAEYAEVTGVDPQDFLAERHVRPLGELGAPLEVPVPEGHTPPPPPAASTPTLDDHFLEDMASTLEEEASAPVAEPEPEPEPEPERDAPPEPEPERDAPPELSLEDDEEEEAPSPLPPLPDPPEAFPAERTLEDFEEVLEDEEPSLPPGMDPAVHQQLCDAVDKIIGCYAEGDCPQALGDLHQLVHAARYDEVKAQIADIWRAMVKHHEGARTRPPFQVTSTFNSINTVIRKLG